MQGKNEGVSRICKELVNETDKRGWMEEEIRAPISSIAATVFTVDGREDSRVWGESEVWKVDAEKQEAGGGHSNIALWRMEGEGVEERPRGPQGGSPQGWAVVEMEATEYTS